MNGSRRPAAVIFFGAGFWTATGLLSFTATVVMGALATTGCVMVFPALNGSFAFDPGFTGLPFTATGIAFTGWGPTALTAGVATTACPDLPGTGCGIGFTATDGFAAEFGLPFATGTATTLEFRFGVAFTLETATGLAVIGWTATAAGFATAAAGFCAVTVLAFCAAAAPVFTVTGEGLALALAVWAAGLAALVFGAGFSTTVGVCATAVTVNARNSENASVLFIRSCLLPLPELRPESCRD
jgi:hypothetical protein